MPLNREQPQPQKPSTLWRITQTVFKLIITAGVLWFIVSKIGWRTISSRIVNADFSFLTAALLVFFISGILGVVQWRIILHNRKLPLTFGRAFSLYFIGMFFNNISLGIAGDAVKVAYIKLAGDGRGTTGFAATFLDRFAGLWTMLGFAVAGCILVAKQKMVASQSMDITLLTLCAMFVMFGALGAFLISTRLQKVVFTVFDRLPFFKSDRIRALITETVLETSDKHIVLPVALLSILVQSLRISVHILCALALGLVSAENISYFFVLVPIYAISMIVPLPFGLRESMGGGLFALAGFQVDAAIVMQFLATLVGVVASLVGGVLFLLGTHSRSNKIKESA